MSDRLGRREDETPFVVEWFVRNGIEVWSTIEGQQRFDNHVDKLMNYIRYWQASGESIKTSIRTKTRLGQIVQEGRFRGGTVPYGYGSKRGAHNKKTMRSINSRGGKEAVLVRLILRSSHEGFAAQRSTSFCTIRAPKPLKGELTNTTIIKC